MKPTDALMENAFYWVETNMARPIICEWRDCQLNGSRNYRKMMIDEMIGKGTMRIAGPIHCPFTSAFQPLTDMDTEDMLDYEEEE
jgi:hypothetical protein